jgi:hypothetical protein
MGENTGTQFDPHRHLGRVLLTGAMAWAAQFYTFLVVTGEACRDATESWGPLSGSGVRALLGILSLAALTSAGMGMRSAYRHWKALSGRRDLIHAEATNQEEFMAFCGVLVGGVFVVGIFWTALPIFTQFCSRAR